VVLALALHAGTGGGHGEVLAFDTRQVGNARLLGNHYLVRVEVKPRDDLQISVGVALKAVGTVEALVAVAGDGDGDLRLPLGDLIQIVDTAVGRLAGGADIINFGVPQVGDSRAYGVQRPAGTGGGKVDGHRIVGDGIAARGGGPSGHGPAAGDIVFAALSTIFAAAAGKCAHHKRSGQRQRNRFFHVHQTPFQMLKTPV